MKTNDEGEVHSSHMIPFQPESLTFKEVIDVKSENGMSITRLFDYDRYWEIALESRQTSTWKNADFDRKSIFCRCFEDLVFKDNDELRVFWLYLHANRQQNALVFLLESKEILRSGDRNEKDIDEILSRYRDLECSNSEQDFSDCCVDRLMRLHEKVESRIKAEIFPAYQKSIYHYRYQRQILREHRYTLADLIYYEHSLRHLREFCESTKLTNALSFWLASDDFRYCVRNKLFKQYSEVLLDGISIYRKYISPQGNYYLGLDEALRTRIECCLSPNLHIKGIIDSHQQGRYIEADTFDQAMWIVYQIMQNVIDLKFKSSLTYLSFLNELSILSGHSIDSSKPTGDSDLAFGRLTWLGRFVNKRKESEHFEIKNDGSNGRVSNEQSFAEKFAEEFIEDILLSSTSSALTTVVVPKIPKGATRND
ncbi:hypothetical protein ACOME3_005829 [Neoechinorhynchus agilis]